MIAITGATGHLGQAILRQLRIKGEDVTAIVRAGSDRNLLKGFCEKIAEAPLDDAEGLAQAFDGAAAVIHAAALIDIRRGQLKAMNKVNVTGTENVLKACRAAGVGRLVYLSSIEALNLRGERLPITEEAGLSRGDAIMEYGNTKAEATGLVVDAGLRRSPETVSLCPTSIIGPWDYKDGLFTTMIRRFLAGKMPAAIPGGFDFVDVRDAAAGVIAAVERGRTGEMYLLTGERISVKELFRILERHSGVHAPKTTLPLWSAKVSGEVCEAYSRITGRKALFTKSSIEILQVDADFDSSKARGELGYRSRTVSESLADTVKWLRLKTEVNPAPAEA